MVDDFEMTDYGGVPVDNPPTVSSTVPADGAIGVTAGANLSVTFSEPVTVTGNWFQIVCSVSGTRNVSDTLVTGGPTTFTINPNTDFTASETCSVTIYAAQVADQDGTPDNMAADYTAWSFTIAGGFTKIHDIQGSGSTAASGTFSVEAIVIGDYQGLTGVDDYKLDGFFIQEEDADADASAATSEGIFVYCATCPTNVVVGDKVQVTGATSEYFNMSQLNATTAGAVVVVSSGNTLPTPAALTLPVPGVTATDLTGATTQINAYYESFEGMLVQFGAQLSVTEYFELFRYGQVVLAQGGRFRQFTDIMTPSTTGYTAHQIDLAKRTVILDDDSNQQNHALMENPDIAVFHPVPGFSTTNYFRGGDTITNLTGVLHWSFAGLTGTDAWRIRPVMDASKNPVFNLTFSSGNPRTSAPVSVGGNLQVGSFNTLNFFTTLDDGTAKCGVVGNKQTCRGANSAAELTRQLDKLVAAICALDADVLGLMELENLDPANDPNLGDGIADYVLKYLVDALNAAGSPCTDKTYAFTDNTAAGTDAIRQGIIYKTSSVTPIGAPVALTLAAFTDPNNTGSQRNRPALAQTFEDKTWGERFTIVPNHLKSKGCSTSPTLDTDQGDGQGCWNDTRQKAAAYLVNTWLPSDPTLSGDPDFIVVGDLNSYRLEAPITNITAAGYADLIHTLAGASAYGYVFDGQLGYLDHALSSATLTPQVAGATEWHINADEVNLLDYNDTVQDAAEQTFDAKPTATTLYNADPYRSTDHDPVLVGLSVYPDQGDLAASYGSAWHTGQGALRLGSLWTSEASSTPGGDNPSDDGVTLSGSANWGGGAGAVLVAASSAGCLNGWMDFTNGVGVGAAYADGDFGDSYLGVSEHLIVNVPVIAGTIQVGVPAPPGLLAPSATSYAFRFRLSPGPCTTAIQPTGRVDGGEVEDYTFTFSPLAVTLASFSAEAGAEGVTLAWETVSETDNAGFNVYRTGSVGDQPEQEGWVRLNDALIAAAAPGSSEGHSYTWTDAAAAAGAIPGATYWYALEDVALDGTATRHAPVVVTLAAPNAVGLATFSAAPGAGPALAGLASLALAAAAAVASRRRRK